MLLIKTVRNHDQKGFCDDFVQLFFFCVLLCNSYFYNSQGIMGTMVGWGKKMQKETSKLVSPLGTPRKKRSWGIQIQIRILEVNGP